MQRVIVIGGGATGAGVLWDLALRGVPAMLVEQGDLVHGTSSRYHGLLHSGGRYAVKDPVSAAECAQENATVRRIAPWAVEPCGGLFVQLEQDDRDYAHDWVKACRSASISIQALDPVQLRHEEPGLNSRMYAAYRVPDASVDGFRLVAGNVAAAQMHGAHTLTYHKVVGLLTENGRVSGVRVQNQHTGHMKVLEAELVINAAGAWADRITAMAGIHLDLVADRGTLLVFHGRLTGQVINRLRPPGDGDIFVPAGSVTLLGTTAVPVGSPEECEVPPDEVGELLGLGAELLPAASSARVLRAFAGIRPLMKAKEEGASTRDLPRTFVVLDHEAEHGVAGLISVLGGKLTTYRLMAERVVDLAVAKLGISAPCRTAVEPILPPPDPDAARRVTVLAGPERAERIADRHPAGLGAVAAALAQPSGRQVICECEQVTAGELVATARALPNPSLSDLRRRTRLGMGTCQGAFCGYRAALVLAETGVVGAAGVAPLLRAFMDERWRGMASGVAGLGLRAAEMDYALYAGPLQTPGDWGDTDA
ncbi:MAG TPA: anaerobic glycerol-3-phosphate dehydrogenase subunit GlpA [Symbiobacteriaceae bacterium]|nr:anaerobic glycerol-3-phosphate dehydrogenase subunit GlpA [Symbiobacteriaceae bacterium]